MKIGEFEVDEKMLVTGAVCYLLGWALKGMGLLLLVLVIVATWAAKNNNKKVKA